MSRFADYADAIAGGEVRLPWKYELVDSDGVVLASTEPPGIGDAIQWGAISDDIEFGQDNRSPRSGTLRLPVDRDELLPVPGRMLHPDSGNRVLISSGVRSSSGQDKFWPQGTMLIDEATIEDQDGVVVAELSLLDPLVPVRSSLEGRVLVAAGTPVSDLVDQLLAEVLPAGSYTVATTGMCTMPLVSFPLGADRYEILNEVLAGCGQELVANASGHVLTRPILPSGDDEGAERWSYGASTGGIPVARARRVETFRRPHGWRIEGGSVTSFAVDITVFDTDPASQGFYGQDGAAHIIGSSRLPYVSDIEQAAEAGYAQLRLHGIGPALVEFWTAPNPAMQEGDLLVLDLPRLEVSGTFRVLSRSLPVVVGDGSLMRVEARMVYDPAANFDPPFNRGNSCVNTINDSFDRPNQNLENLEGSPGSDDWTEIWPSWGVVNEQAVQRYTNGWSLAFLNTPLCSTDHEAAVEVARCPSGRRVGPMVRCSGEFDGYTALTDTNGSIALESWLGGKRVATLGSHNAGGSIEGRTLSISAVGTVITVKLNNETIITATDSARTGPHVGMLGYGGTETTGPAVESFTAGAAS